MSNSTEQWHGTPSGYTGIHQCRCEYCTAAQRVRARRMGGPPTLLEAVREAARTGAPIPAAAERQRRGREPQRLSRLSEGELSARRNTAAAAVAEAHQARLRAVERAEHSPAALAMLAVSEYTQDEDLALRYERVGLALAGVRDE